MPQGALVEDETVDASHTVLYNEYIHVYACLKQTVIPGQS